MERILIFCVCEIHQLTTIVHSDSSTLWFNPFNSNYDVVFGNFSSRRVPKY